MLRIQKHEYGSDHGRTWLQNFEEKTTGFRGGTQQEFAIPQEAISIIHAYLQVFKYLPFNEKRKRLTANRHR